ncbi:MAG: hypothetical protein WBF53_02975 [Litorimonas sp.]
MIAEAGEVGGLNAADLNYTDYLEEQMPKGLSDHLGRAGLALNGLAMRYNTEPGIKIGAFTNPDAAVRQVPVELPRRGMGARRAMGGTVMTLRMGQDEFD